MTESPLLRASKPTDAEDVAWALSTAESLWSRGEKVEALRWVRRAAEEASDAGHDERALELAKLASELSAKFSTPPPPSVVTSAPATSASAPGTPAPAAQRPVARPSTAPAPRPSSAPRPAGGKIPSFTSTLPVKRPAAPAFEDEPTMMSGGDAPKPHLPSEPPTTPDSSPWPQTHRFEDEATISNAPSTVISSTQAIRVFVASDGRVTIAGGAAPPPGASEAILVALSPNVDWSKLLR